MIILLGVFTSMGVMISVYKLIFSGADELEEAITFWFKPDSIWDGWQGFVKEFKFSILISSGFLTFWAVYNTFYSI